jgi:hypothetical protein
MEGKVARAVLRGVTLHLEKVNNRIERDRKPLHPPVSTGEAFRFRIVSSYLEAA